MKINRIQDYINNTKPTDISVGSGLTLASNIGGKPLYKWITNFNKNDLVIKGVLSNIANIIVKHYDMRSNQLDSISIIRIRNSIDTNFVVNYQDLNDEIKSLEDVPKREYITDQYLSDIPESLKKIIYNDYSSHIVRPVITQRTVMSNARTTGPTNSAYVIDDSQYSYVVNESGLDHIGSNYLQEDLGKLYNLSDYFPDKTDLLIPKGILPLDLITNHFDELSGYNQQRYYDTVPLPENFLSNISAEYSGSMKDYYPVQVDSIFNWVSHVENQNIREVSIHSDRPDLIITYNNNTKKFLRLTIYKDESYVPFSQGINRTLQDFPLRYICLGALDMNYSQFRTLGLQSNYSVYEINRGDYSQDHWASLLQLRYRELRDRNQKLFKLLINNKELIKRAYKVLGVMWGHTSIEDAHDDDDYINHTAVELGDYFDNTFSPSLFYGLIKRIDRGYNESLIYQWAERNGWKNPLAQWADLNYTSTNLFLLLVLLMNIDFIMGQHISFSPLVPRREYGSIYYLSYSYDAGEIPDVLTVTSDTNCTISIKQEDDVIVEDRQHYSAAAPIAVLVSRANDLLQIRKNFSSLLIDLKADIRSLVTASIIDYFIDCFFNFNLLMLANKFNELSNEGQWLKQLSTEGFNYFSADPTTATTKLSSWITNHSSPESLDPLVKNYITPFLFWITNVDIHSDSALDTYIDMIPGLIQLEDSELIKIIVSQFSTAIGMLNGLVYSEFSVSDIQDSYNRVRSTLSDSSLASPYQLPPLNTGELLGFSSLKAFINLVKSFIQTINLTAITEVVSFQHSIGLLIKSISELSSASVLSIQGITDVTKHLVKPIDTIFNLSTSLIDFMSQIDDILVKQLQSYYIAFPYLASIAFKDFQYTTNQGHVIPDISELEDLFFLKLDQLAVIVNAFTSISSPTDLINKTVDAVNYFKVAYRKLTIHVSDKKSVQDTFQLSSPRVRETFNSISKFVTSTSVLDIVKSVGSMTLLIVKGIFSIGKKLIEFVFSTYDKLVDRAYANIIYMRSEGVVPIIIPNRTLLSNRTSSSTLFSKFVSLASDGVVLTRRDGDVICQFEFNNDRDLIINTPISLLDDPSIPYQLTYEGQIIAYSMIQLLSEISNLGLTLPDWSSSHTDIQVVNHSLVPSDFFTNLASDLKMATKIAYRVGFGLGISADILGSVTFVGPALKAAHYTFIGASIIAIISELAVLQRYDDNNIKQYVQYMAQIVDLIVQNLDNLSPYLKTLDRGQSNTLITTIYRRKMPFEQLFDISLLLVATMLSSHILKAIPKGIAILTKLSLKTSKYLLLRHRRKSISNKLDLIKQTINNQDASFISNNNDDDLPYLIN